MPQTLSIAGVPAELPNGLQVVGKDVVLRAAVGRRRCAANRRKHGQNDAEHTTVSPHNASCRRWAFSLFRWFGLRREKRYLLSERNSPLVLYGGQEKSVSISIPTLPG